MNNDYIVLISSEELEKIYCLLKGYTYQENLNLFLKEKIASFENQDLDTALVELVRVLNDTDTLRHPKFCEWLEEISYRLIQKDVKCSNESKKQAKGPLFLTNVKTESEYLIEKVNYFVDAPVQLHIIEVLWTVLAGSLLDNQLSNDCYGNRIHEQTKSFSKEFFNFYFYCLKNLLRFAIGLLFLTSENFLNNKTIC